MNALNQAIVAMNYATHEYNRGVLAAIGKEQLAINYASSHRQVNELAAKRDAAQGDAGLFAPLNEEAQNYEDALRKMTKICNNDWAAIQEIIDSARASLDAEDDGMGWI